MIVLPSLRRAGAETQAVDMANGLARNGHQVHVFTFLPELNLLDRLDSSVVVHHHLRNSKYSMGYISRLSEILDINSIDIIYSVMQFSGLVSWIASFRSARKPKVVVAIHTTANFDNRAEVFDRVIYRALFRWTSTIIFVCEFQRRFWLDKYPEMEKKSVVVYNGIDLEHFNPDTHVNAGIGEREKLGIDENAFVFCCIAGFRPEKGHRLLIEAFSELPQGPMLLLAGDGVRKFAAEKLIRDLGLSDRVFFLGNVSDVRPIIAACDATVLASETETFSMAMLESLAMATPMIAPEIGGLPEALINGETGLLFPVGNKGALRDSMLNIMSSREKSRKLGLNGLKIVRNQFGLDRMIHETETILEKAIRK